MEQFQASSINKFNKEMFSQMVTKTSKLTVSDVLVEHIKEWNSGDIITVTAGTGVGKSYFIKNQLYPIAKKEGKKILFFVNRTRLADQFKQEIIRDKKDDVIEIILYQSLEYKLKQSELYVKEQYKYIVCDEFHYFLTESKYNDSTDESLNLILKENEKIRIFMSATSNAMIEYFNSKSLKYHAYKLPFNFDHIEKLLFFKNDKVCEKFLRSIDPSDKVIYFSKSAKRAYELHETFENSMFVCSDSGTTKERRFLDKDKIMTMLQEEKFNEQFLFTTSTLDNGINLFDKEIKYIVASIIDIDILLQCLGRKRIIDKQDKVTVIIKDISNKMLNKLIDDGKRQLEPADYLIENGTYKYIQKYKKKRSRLVYDKECSNNESQYEKVINDLIYFKEQFDIRLFEKMMEQENGYMEYIKDLLMQDSYEVLDDEFEKSTICDYLDTLVNKRLFKEEQDKLINIINLRDNRNRQQKDIKMLNVYFESNNIPYTIRNLADKRRKLEDGSPNPYRDKRYWVVTKFSDA